jgi:hypothetical protein
VPKEPIEQEQMDLMCPFMVEELDLYIGESETFKDSDEATIYALCQLLHNRLAKLDMKPEDKGGVVSALIIGLSEFNATELALHNEVLKAIREQKASTIN